MSEHIEAKPTSYRGTRHRSRLEARWAVFLDYHQMVDHFAYEPLKVQHPTKAWDYIPDFIWKVGPLRGFLEVKPVEPTKEEVETLKEFSQVLRWPLWLAVGSFYRTVPRLRCLTDGQGPYKLDAFPFLPGPEDAIKMARNFRFDLPHGAPPFRSGSQEQLQGHIRRWTKQQRQGKPTKKKPVKRKRSRSRRKKKGGS